MKHFILLLLVLFLTEENAKCQAKKMLVNEKVLFISAASGDLQDADWYDECALGGEFQFLFQHLIPTYSKTMGDGFKNKPIVLLYQSSIRIGKNYDAFWRNSILYSLWNKNRRTGPFSGHQRDLMNAGISFQNGLEMNGAKLIGFQMNFKFYPEMKISPHSRINFHLGLNYFLPMNERSEEFGGFFAELAIRLRLNKLAIQIF